MRELGRVLTAMVTPLNPDGSINYGQAAVLGSGLVQSGSDGVVVLGTTGESPTITKWSERKELIEAVVSGVNGKGSVVAGAGDNCTADSIELAKATAAIPGVDGLLLPVPYYNKPTQEGMLRHFDAIADAVGDMPCIPYNIPGRTGVNMDDGTTLLLATIPNIVGIKEASGDLDQVGRIIQGAPEGFKVWSGNDEDTLPIVERGGYGVISVVSHLVGQKVAQMIDWQLKGKPLLATAIQVQLEPLIKALFCVTNPLPIKFALNELGFDVGGYRLPLTEPMSNVTRDYIMTEVRKHEIDLLVPL